MRVSFTDWFERTVWARWAAVVPGSLLSGAAVHFPIHWVVILGTTFLRSGPDSDTGGLSLWNLPAERLEQYVVALLVPGVMVYMAAKIAPMHRFTTAIVAAVAYGVVYGALIGFLLGSRDELYENLFLDMLLPVALNIVGVWQGVKNARELSEPARSPRGRATV